MPEPFVNLSALEPLFLPHEEPNRHRTRAKGDKPAQASNGRRPSPITIAQALRSHVKAWREVDYAGASDTTRELLHHWFERDHLMQSADGIQIPFSYYYCQREAIETLIYLYEVRGIRALMRLVAEFGGPDAETAALGVNPDDDRWAKYAFKLATGAGKTKVMSLAMVWSYFHALRESGSTLARHFVVIAPNLTVFERLKQDFKPAEGGQDIFDRDPLIPVAWRGDWNLSVVLQDEASGAGTGGTLYLTNIHRLYDTSSRRKKEAETYDWMGPTVSRAKALDTGAALLARVTGHARIMVLNDEAHHLWDPGSAWNEAIARLQETISERTGQGLVAQLDFSATPKDNSGRIFQHVICDTPLGEAVDAGIVKTPVIGRGKGWQQRTNTDASVKYQEQLMVGYARWLKSKEEWSKSGKKPLLFVMTESTKAADHIARRLNTDPQYGELNGKTFNLHTNLKGKVKWIGGQKKGYPVFEESESDITDEDLKALRELSRQVDSDQNPYGCIVSVLMLREGWDVRNVTTIVPLRPLTAKSDILPEQTLGRGLRRMTPPGEAAELVITVEHPAFVSLFQKELEQEGLFIEAIDVENIPKTTVTIFPDKEHKDVAALEILVPSVSSGFSRIASISGLGIEDVRRQFSRYRPLPVGEKRPEEIQFEGRQLITNELVERMNVRLPLLENGIGAISFYREELEHITGLKGTHSVLAPLLETFLSEMLFEEKLTLFDQRLVSRIGDADVREHIRATFVPLILKRTTVIEQRKAEGKSAAVSLWKPFQVTHSASHPAVPAERTLFNLVTCNRDLEVAMSQFLDHAPDVTAFCKNAGPQCLRVDYLSGNGQLSFYTPDFLARTPDGNSILIETKGRVDKDVPSKARAAVAWCKAGSKARTKWTYLYVPQQTFEAFADNRLVVLIRSCEPALQDLLDEAKEPQLTLALGEARADETEAFITKEEFAGLPPAHQKMVEQAVSLFQFLEKKAGQSLAPVFTPLLGPIDEASRAVLLKRLGPGVPADAEPQRAFFEPALSGLAKKQAEMYERRGKDLRRTLVDHNGLSPIGLLRWCLQYALESEDSLPGIFAFVKQQFSGSPEPTYKLLNRINGFRNEYVAHQNKELTDSALTRDALREWASGLCRIWQLLHQARD